jgi:hypothetical protein
VAGRPGRGRPAAFVFLRTRIQSGRQRRAHRGAAHRRARLASRPIERRACNSEAPAMANVRQMIAMDGSSCFETLRDPSSLAPPNRGR